MATIRFDGEQWVLYKEGWENPLMFDSHEAAKAFAYQMRVDITEDSY